MWHVTRERSEREFPFQIFPQFSLVNFLPSWVGNNVFHYHSQSQKLGIGFFFPIPNPNFFKTQLSILLGNKFVSMYHFLVLGLRFTLNKDD